MKNCISRLCTTPCTHVSHYWSFRVFGMGFDRPLARLETPKNVLSYPSRHILSQHPCLHPSEWVPGVGEVAKTANTAKMARKCIKCTRPTPPHTNPMELGLGNIFRLKIEINQKIHDFQPKKGGAHFLDTFDPPTPIPPPSFTKVGFKWGGVWGGVPKTHWAMHFLDKIMILHGVKLTIQLLGVGYTNRPKMGGLCGVYMVFPYIRACLALI